MLVLGLETSCDETAAAVVEDGVRVRSSAVASQHELHAEYGGVVPEIASRAHVERLMPTVREALDGARVTLGEIDVVAVGHRPGLIGSLLVGVSAAKALAWSLSVPLVGVDHVHAHLHAGLLDRGEPAYPALGLVVSGGHTSLYRCDSPIELTRLGATIDDAMGEAFDKAAAILGLPHPGGPNLDRLASEEGADERAHEFPVSRLGRDSLDFSFSGLKTSLLYRVCGMPRPKSEGGGFERDHTTLTHGERRDLAASFRRAGVDAAILKLGRALGQLRDDGVGARSLLTGGGVTANSLLRSELERFAGGHGLELRLPELRFCVDNAAMIGGLAYELFGAGRVADLSLAAQPTTAC